jgi:hypothetical protein
MNPEAEWENLRGARASLFGAGVGALRVALLFGSAAVAFALIIAPIAEKQTRRFIAAGPQAGLDMTSTGSVPYRGSYTVRRSVLQPGPDAVCIIRDNGRRSGACY